MSNKKTSGGFPLVVSALAIVICIGIGWFIYKTILGSASNFEGGDSEKGHPHNILETWLAPVIKKIPNLPSADAGKEWLLMGISVTLASISAFLAYHFYVRSPETPKKFAASIKPIYNVIYNKYFVDEAYEKTLIRPLVRGSQKIWQHIDVNFIDKTTYVVSDLVQGGGGLVRSLQSGNLQQYALYFALGIVVAMSIILMR